LAPWKQDQVTSDLSSDAVLVLLADWTGLKLCVVLGFRFEKCNRVSQ